MSYYNTITHAEISKLPTTIPPFKGLELPRDEQKYLDAGWLMAEIVPFVVPEGYVVIAGTRRIEVVDGVPNEVWTIETIAGKEAQRIAALAAIYGQQVGQFAGLLAVFGLAMPIEEDVAAAGMYAGVKADVTKTADSQMAMVIYNTLKENLSDDDIYAIAKSIGVAE